MSVAIYNFEWEQGEDAEINLIYKEKASPSAEALPVNLTNYTIRMDIATQGDSTRVWTFNSSDNAGASPIDEPGNADNEATLGTDGSISVLIPRSLTLPSGAVYTQIQAGKLVFTYDLFLRAPSLRQKKILKGIVTVNPSTTLWA